MSWPWSKDPKRTSAERAVRPRAATRLNPVGISCKYGNIVDMSQNGARIRSAKPHTVKVGSLLQLSIGTATTKVEVQAKVMWIREARKGLDAHDMGVRFVDLAPGVGDEILELARFGFVRRKPGEKPAGAAAASTPIGEAPPASSTSGSSRVGNDLDDLYAALSVAQDATAEEIHKAFRDKARQVHPDRNKSPDAEAKFAYLSKAYSVLRDPENRAKYDALVRARQANPANQAA